MAAPNLPSIPSISVSQHTFPVFPCLPSKPHESHTAYSMSSEPISSAMYKPTLPATALSSLSLQENGQASPTPRERKALSESSLSTTTPPESNRDAPVIIDQSRLKSSNAADKTFVKAQDTDDVFGRSSSTTPSQRSRPRSSASIVIARARADLIAPVPFIKSPRPDRLKSPITPANAQGVLPPAAVVFAANLSIHREIPQLEADCQNRFKEFGSCHVKVKKDKRDHPFAIIQFHRVEDAKRAIATSQKEPIILDGRTIRCEPGEARRAIVLFRLDGGPVTHEEATEVLEGYGSIETMYPITNGESLNQGLPRGMYVQFAYWQDYHDTVKQFNNTASRYRIHIPRRAESRNRAAQRGSPMYKGFWAPRSITDQKSVFVGSLPAQTSEQDLRDIFDNCGTIKAVNIIHKQIQGGTGLNIFGFVEFSDASEAEVAALQEREIYGYKIRIEPKEYSIRHASRQQTQNYATPPSYGYPQVSPPYYYGQALSPFYDQNLSSYQNQNTSPYGYERTRSPLTHNNVSNLHHICGNGMRLGYNQGYFHTASPAYQGSDSGYNNSIQNLTPYGHHQSGHNGIGNFYATPPPSYRMNRRNDVVCSGSPHGMAHWSPFLANSAYAGQLMQIPENYEQQQY